MKYYLILFLCFLSINSFGQTGIGTTSPDPSAKLDVTSSNKGFLPPRVTLTGYMDNSTIPSPATGLLVYNTGTNANLAAGYYYWNGSSWATIATAGGSGSFAASFMRGSRIASQNMNVNDAVVFTNTDISSGSNISLNSTTGKITLTAGNTYRLIGAVPGFSGSRPSFSWYNETAATTIGSAANGYSPSDGAGNGSFGGIAEVIFTPSVTTVVYLKLVSVLGSTSTGSISTSNGDFTSGSGYPWFEAQVISGNAPVTGQSVDYGIVKFTGSDTGPLTAGSNVSLDASASGNLVWSNNKFTLKANKTYELESYLAVYQTAGSVGGVFQLFDYTNNAVLANGLFISMNGTGTNNPSGNGPMRAIVTPASDIQVGIKFISFYGTGNAPGLIGSANNATGGAPNQCYFIAKQIGSSAFVNPWVLNGNDVYNTIGSVGIGTSSPNISAILDASSTSKGILIPRLTASQKNAIASPTNGLLIFQTDAPSDFYFYNGSSWVSLREPNWTSAGSIQSVGWSATTTNPTIGTTTVNDYSYKQVGSKTWKCQLLYTAPNNSTGNNGGSGDYLFTLPNGLQFNTSIPGQAINIDNIGTSSWIWPSLWLSNSTGTITNLGQAGLLYVVPYSSTQFRLIHVGIAGIGYVIPYGSGYYGVGANLSWRVTFTFQSM